jgi:hypothetical protein
MARTAEGWMSPAAWGVLGLENDVRCARRRILHHDWSGPREVVDGALSETPPSTRAHTGAHRAEAVRGMAVHRLVALQQ